ncbi:MAG: hypothetical protein COA99_04205 [Moraxellaceae bacterium]|nr:MAG: hypothetical protein COA99_04205 [Moraxellaceae bacterium]
MSYQVLARKWRPKTFREMVGQTHVLKALINALDHGRLHHAYLFTGTRGVGKTTIARILAKSLNCETGVSSEPCGTCGACTEINEGRFIDLIEVDAASRTKVEDTRELLDNVQYAPTRGRYKVYLIDEVHMLSGHSFNALLKTLEEPPPHVKFLLATTDPQKLPVTILSRCLQFSLKAMTPDKIVGHLQHVLAEEMVSFEEPALWALGRAADGSMRDAMSLADQAIAFGNGKIIEEDVQSMLGTIDRAYTYKLLDAIIAGDGPNLLAVVASLAEQSPDYIGVLADLISGLHSVAVAQVVPDAVDNSQGDKEKIIAVARQLTAEDVQLYYQIALLGRKDLPLAPDPRSGFEMILLRMVLFRPEGILPPTNTQGGANANLVGGPRGGNQPAQNSGAQYSAQHPTQNQLTRQNMPVNGGQFAANTATNTFANNAANTSAVPSVTGAVGAVNNPANQSRMQQARAALNGTAVTASQAAVSPVTPAMPVASPISSAIEAEPQASNVIPIGDGNRKSSQAMPVTDTASAGFDNAPAAPVVALTSMQQPYGDFWADLLTSLELNGSVLNFARNCGLESSDNGQWILALGPRHESLYRTHHVETLEKAIAAVNGENITITLEINVPSKDTPDTLASKRRAKRLENAEVSLHSDPFVKYLLENFNGVLDKDSIKPLD